MDAPRPLQGAGFPVNSKKEREHLKKPGKKEISRTVVFQDWQNVEKNLLSFLHGLGQHQRVRDIRYHWKCTIYV